MNYIKRAIEPYIKEMTSQFKVILVTGARQIGKTTMLKNCLGDDYEYVVLDDLNELEQAQQDPNLFFKSHKLPILIDEVQLAPELFRQIKLIVDKDEKKGLVCLTGSQTFRLIQNAGESLAGRICIIDMAGLSLREINGIDFSKPFIPSEKYIEERSPHTIRYENLWQKIHRGSMPELADESISWERYYRSYIRTYINRDIRDLIKASNIISFNKFMISMAARTGELFNAASVANDIGLSLKTVQEWTSMLEGSGIIRLIYPFERNITKRAIKTPKLYFMDTGLVCSLVGWSNATVAQNGAMSGNLFETFVVSEILKSHLNAGKDCSNIYFYRDHNKNEIDLIIEENHVLYPIEIKKSAHPQIEMSKAFNQLLIIPEYSVGHGCILCLADKRKELSENVTALPIEFI